MYLIAVSYSLSNTRISILLKKKFSFSSSSSCNALTSFFKILSSLSTPNVITKELTRSKSSPFNSKLNSLDMNVVDYLTYLTTSAFMRFFLETNYEAIYEKVNCCYEISSISWIVSVVFSRIAAKSYLPRISSEKFWIVIFNFPHRSRCF